MNHVLNVKIQWSCNNEQHEKKTTFIINCDLISLGHYFSSLLTPDFDSWIWFQLRESWARIRWGTDRAWNSDPGRTLLPQLVPVPDIRVVCGVLWCRTAKIWTGLIIFQLLALIPCNKIKNDSEFGTQCCKSMSWLESRETLTRIELNTFQFTTVCKLQSTLYRLKRTGPLGKLFTGWKIHPIESQNALWKVQRDTICLFTGTRLSQQRRSQDRVTTV